MSVREPRGEANSRSRLTTGMPAACALIAISVSALPSKGRMTSESTFLSISVWTWLICWLTSLLPSTACRVTSLCLAAWSLALVVMAAIQPWSAAGAEKPMVTALPGVSLPLPLAAALAEDVVADDATLLLVHAVRAAPAPRAPAPRSRPRRPRIGPLDEGDIVDLFRWDVQPGWVRSGPVELGGAGGTPLQEHGADDDHALGDVLRLGRQVVEDEDVGDRREDEHTEEGADDGAAATGEERAADDRRGDRVELVELPVGAGAGRRPGHDHDCGDPAAQARDHVEQDRGAPDVDAGEPGGLGVAADGDGPADERRPVEQDQTERDDDGEDPDEHGDAEDVAAGDADDRLVGDDLGPVLGEPRGEPPGTDEHRQRDDEGHEVAVGDECAVDEAGDGPHGQRAQDHDDGTVGLRLQRGGPDRGERDERPDREVDPAADDHEGHADRDDADDRRAHQDVLDVVPGQEVVARERPDHDEHDEHGDQPEVAHLDVRPAPTEPGPHPARGSRLLRDRSPARRHSRRAGGLVPHGVPAHAALPSMTRSSTVDSSNSSAGASCTTRPSRSTRTRSARPSTSGTSLETRRTPTPESASRRTTAYSSERAPTSTPRVGSSSISTLVEPSSQRASTTFCWLPPDRVRTSLPASAGRTSRSPIARAASAVSRR